MIPAPRALIPILLLITAGCGGREGAAPEPPPVEAKDAAPEGRPAEDPLPAAGAVEGRLSFRGPPPPEPAEAIYTPCGNRARAESLLLSPEGGVQNAVITLEPLSGSDAGPAPAAADEGIPPPARIDNRECRFEPHVQAARIGARLEVLNSDLVFHNINASGAMQFNLGLPGGESIEAGVLRRPGTVKILCDVHGWMSAFIVAAPTPWHAVTGADGRFRIEGAPAGRYTLRIWHETLAGGEAVIDVRDGETARIERELVRNE